MNIKWSTGVKADASGTEKWPMAREHLSVYRHDIFQKNSCRTVKILQARKTTLDILCSKSVIQQLQ